jgi:ADP-dependent NAD(P)H-hydrate dehydratase / NAD(P)H-hydrate epimerase
VAISKLDLPAFSGNKQTISLILGQFQTAPIFFSIFSGVPSSLDIYLKYPGKRTVGAVAGRQGGRLRPPFLFWDRLRIDHRFFSSYHRGVQPVTFTEQMREIDRLTAENYGLPSLLLMEAAGEACLRAIESHFSDGLKGKKARILCGKGNNGGDGAALARALARAGVHCDVILFGKLTETIGDARINLEVVNRLAGYEAGSNDVPSPLTFTECVEVAAWEHLARPRRTYDVIVDALFGTGLSRPLEGVFLNVIDHLSLLTKARDRVSGVRPLVVSVDIPSGLNADKSDSIGPAVRADMTVTFTTAKPANVLPPACDSVGELIVADIGSPASLIEAAKPWLFVTETVDASRWLASTRYTPESYKNTHGHVLIAAGSRGYSGAAALCGDAAIRSGAGLVTIATPASAQLSVANRSMAEVMTTALAETDRGAVSSEAIEHFLQLSSAATVVAIGPGLTSDDERTRRFVHSIVERRAGPVIIDADGLNCLAPWPESLCGSEEHPLILTPHLGEMLRLLGTEDKSALASRVSAVRDFATSHKVILVLKGSRSLIASPDGRVFVNPTGNAGLGTAGAGDTLTGLIAGFVAQAFGTLRHNPSALDATIAALYVGGLAGDFAARSLGKRTMVASDIRDHFGAAIRHLDPEGEQP